MKKPRPNAALPPFPAARFDDAVLRRIAATADHGAEAERHHAALRRIVREQNGLIDGNSQAYYPADALELCALGQADGNAAAFTLSHLLIVRSALAETCPFTLPPLWRQYQAESGILPPSLQETLDAAYRAAHENGLIDDNW